MSDPRGTIPPTLTPVETFIRILPSILLFTILIWCCCKGEAPNSTRAFESPEDRRARREAMESQLIIKNVIRASTPRRPSRFTSSDRASSSFVLSIRMPNSNGQDVKFSEDDESLIIQAEEGKLHHAVATDQDDSPHAAAAACVHFSDSTIHNQAGKQQEQQEDQQNVNDDDDQDADAAARQALASDAEHPERDSSLRSDSNRTNVSWIPSEEEEESSCSSEHHYQQQQQQQEQQLPEQPLALPPPTTTTTTAPTVRGRRKSNILARTISMSLRSSISSLQQQQQQQQQPTTCDICLMDYQVGEQVCWSPNDECVHCFHKDCMLDWLLRNPKCPVCRRNYLVKQDDSHQQQPQQPQEEETSQNARHSSDREFES